MRRVIASSFGNIPTTSVRRSISPFNRPAVGNRPAYASHVGPVPHSSYTTLRGTIAA